MSLPSVCPIRLHPWAFNRVLSSASCRRERAARLCVNAESDGFAELANWAEFHGGFVHQSLTAGFSSVTGERGVISESDLSADDLFDAPLIIMPEKLHMSPSTAVQTLDALLKPLGLPSVQNLSSEMQVALLLAYEKERGQDSMWFPYIEMLPKEPNCGYLWPYPKVEKYFSTLPVKMDKLMPAYSRAQQMHARECDAKVDDAWDAFGDALGVSKNRLTWSLCQVSSRAFVVEGTADVELKPVIDLVNHSHEALPLGVVYGDDRVTFVEAADPLPAGSELFIDYLFDPESPPLLNFMHFGFIPEELILGAARKGSKNRKREK
ncbi:hypothetical protein BSKO_05166 [Bryopsis sp. KO-2023]|nr:hypothetical protein BSKO_05166 [Bryopsis sp. KO-2023]